MKSSNRNLTFQEAIDTTIKIIRRFEKIEGKPWQIEGAVIELTKQLGDLAKLIMSHEGYYYASRQNESNYNANKQQIADELADILLAVIRIADHYEIDLVETHIKTRLEEDQFLKSKGV